MDEAYGENLKRMFEFLKGDQCAADILAPVYQLKPSTGVAKACGGCAHCRLQSRQRDTEPAMTAVHPWDAAGTQQLLPSKLVYTGNRVVIFYPDEIEQRVHRRWIEALGKLARSGVRNIISVPGAPIIAEEVQKEVPKIALFAAADLPPTGELPPGPTMMFLSLGYQIRNLTLRTREAADSHFIFVHHETKDPDVSSELLSRRANVPQYTDLNLFIEQVSR